jgi:hypothetical protein
MSDILSLQVTVLICGTIALVSTLGFVRRYLELRQERRDLPPGDELATRLERIEQIVESTAIEVERVSEANRFLSKLLADRTGASNPAAAPAPPRVITPH